VVTVVTAVTAVTVVSAVTVVTAVTMVTAVTAVTVFTCCLATLPRVCHIMTHSHVWLRRLESCITGERHFIWQEDVAQTRYPPLHSPRTEETHGIGGHNRLYPLPSSN